MNGGRALPLGLAASGLSIMGQASTNDELWDFVFTYILEYMYSIHMYIYKLCGLFVSVVCGLILTEKTVVDDARIKPRVN